MIFEDSIGLKVPLVFKGNPRYDIFELSNFKIKSSIGLKIVSFIKLS